MKARALEWLALDPRPPGAGHWGIGRAIEVMTKGDELAVLASAETLDEVTAIASRAAAAQEFLGRIP